MPTGPSDSTSEVATERSTESAPLTVPEVPLGMRSQASTPKKTPSLSKHPESHKPPFLVTPASAIHHKLKREITGLEVPFDLLPTPEPGSNDDEIVHVKTVRRTRSSISLSSVANQSAKQSQHRSSPSTKRPRSDSPTTSTWSEISASKKARKSAAGQSSKLSSISQPAWPSKNKDENDDFCSQV